MQQSLVPALPFPPTICILQAGALCGRGGESCRQKENRVLGFLQLTASCLLRRFGGGQGTVGAPSRLWAGGKEAKMQLQAAGSELEQCGRALYSSQSGHTEQICPAEGCRAVLIKHSPIAQVCSDCTSCSSSSHCRSSELTRTLTKAATSAIPRRTAAEMGHCHTSAISDSSTGAAQRTHAAASLFLWGLGLMFEPKGLMVPYRQMLGSPTEDAKS
ncbi:uncharacterized protein LOC122192507 [Lagopus leucura]|uniref:uncharacterized protein LOC122192507 n=1 Tax=Lagopus leucura TaxID=30410 RepID=UPI001C676DA3|nr:uncharacterized protein LOC122192507 [Lagopus leucura]